MSKDDLVMRVIEECAELTKALCKAQKFGWDSFHPKKPERLNGDHVLQESEDVLNAIITLLKELEREDVDNGTAKL